MDLQKLAGCLQGKKIIGVETRAYVVLIWNENKEMETSSHVRKFLCIFLFGVLYFSEENLKLSRPVVVDHGW